MPMVTVHQDVYLALDSLRQEAAKQKRQAGAPTKTTFNEVIFQLLNQVGRI